VILDPVDEQHPYAFCNTFIRVPVVEDHCNGSSIESIFASFDEGRMRVGATRPGILLVVNRDYFAGFEKFPKVVFNVQALHLLFRVSKERRFWRTLHGSL